MGWHNLTNTAQFSYTARDFSKNGGRYCLAPVGSREWEEFWAIEAKRCKEGYKIGDTWITGRHYFYLNFAPIWKVPDNIGIQAFNEAKNGKGKIGKLTAEKIFSFPRFYEIGYEWNRFKHIAWHGGEFMGIQSPGARHMVCAKARGAGWSYMEAADGVYNYVFIDGSKNYYYAGIEQYLTTDGILNKVLPMLDWVNDNCPDWKKNRQKKNTLMHMRASYVDSFGVERGSMSEIMGVVVDDPDKTRGKRGRKITFEESGSLRNLKKAYNVCQGSMKDGDIYVGQITVLGTGGEEGPDIEGLEDMFYDPESFDMLAFPNVWEPGFENTTCGYFVPVWRTKSTFMDENGNVDIVMAIESEKKIRVQKKKAKDPQVLDGHKAEYPLFPSEAFKRLRKNSFNVAEVDAQIRRIETQQAIQGMLRYGHLIRDEKLGVMFIPQPKDVAKPVEQYPHNQKDDLEGCITIVAAPFRDQRGNVPDGMYQIVVDPYYKEESEDLTSLFVVQVWKQFNQLSPVDEELPIAWYVGRPQNLDTAYANLFMLSDLYNCTIQSEIAGGGQGIVDYAKTNKLLHKLEREPEMMGNNKEYNSTASQRNRAIFMNMGTEKARLGITYLVNWHTKVRGYTEDGKPILNIHRCYDIGMLREMKKYNPEKNADRLSAGRLAMFMLKENAYKEESRTTEDDQGFYTRPLFGGNYASQGAGSTSMLG